MSNPSNLLSALLAIVNDGDDRAMAEALLHTEVRLHRLDGTEIAGRASVLEAVVSPRREVRFVVVGPRPEGIDVALQVTDVPGRLVFAMHASVRDGLLYEIWMIV